MPKKNKKGRAAKAGSAVEAPRKPAPVVAAWETYMGSSELEDWQRLMSDLGFEEEFPSKTQCRKVRKANEPPLPPSTRISFPLFTSFC